MSDDVAEDEQTPEEPIEPQEPSVVWTVTVTSYSDGTVKAHTETTKTLSRWTVARELCRGAASFFNMEDVPIYPPAPAAPSAVEAEDEEA